MVTCETWLVTGCSGQVGGALVAARPPGVRILAPGREALDLARVVDIDGLLFDEAVTLIVNCAAYTAVDQAEMEAELAHRINGAAPGELAQAAVRAAIPIIHVSTDYVFSGDKASGPYLEDDPVGPSNVYGASKLAGERAVAASGARHAIARTAWVVSARGHNFVRTMLRLGQEKERIGVVADQRGSPTAADDLASALVRLGNIMRSDPDASPGVLHLANAGHVSWHDLAAHVFARAARHGYRVPALDAIATKDYPTPAVRPANSMLDTSRAARRYGIVFAPWQDAVDRVVDAIMSKDLKR